MEENNIPSLNNKLGHKFLCTAEFEVANGLFTVGVSPLGEQRVGYVTGGRIFGPRMNGQILPGGGNWSRAARLADGHSLGTFDARIMWKLDDGALAYVTYQGRSVVSDDVRADFADPTQPWVDPARYYLRIAPVFETSSKTYDWLNRVLAIGVGERTNFGVRHQIYEIL